MEQNGQVPEGTSMPSLACSFLHAAQQSRQALPSGSRGDASLAAQWPTLWLHTATSGPGLKADDLRARVTDLTQWKQGDVRAPHKPLLLLYALARFAEGIEQFPFNRTEKPLVQLLNDFGPPRKRHDAYSFWRLPKDGLWTISGDDDIRRTPSKNWFVTDARRDNPVGRFPYDVAAVLRANPPLISELVETLLDAHFEPSYHEDLLTALGFDPDELLAGQRARRKRDPKFREAVLRAYGYKCAVCGFEARVGSTLIGVDAAHVKWHRAHGSDEVSNGVALCALHHRLLDRGAFTLTASSTRERVVVVGEDTHGGEGFERWLLDYHGLPLAAPVREGYRVAEPAMEWHHREVFRGPART